MTVGFVFAVIMVCLTFLLAEIILLAFLWQVFETWMRDYWMHKARRG